MVDLSLRDYVQPWYHPFVGGSTDLLSEGKSLVALIMSDLSRRCQEPELLPLFMEALVAVLIDHFKLYKGALLQVTPGEFNISREFSNSLFFFSDKDVEKCIAECDSEGWSLICRGGEPELGTIVRRHGNLLL